MLATEMSAGNFPVALFGLLACEARFLLFLALPPLSFNQNSTNFRNENIFIEFSVYIIERVTSAAAAKFSEKMYTLDVFVAPLSARFWKS